MQVNINGRPVEVEEIKSGNDVIGIVAQVPDQEFEFVAAASVALLKKGRGWSGYRTRQEAVDAVRSRAR